MEPAKKSNVIPANAEQSVFVEVDCTSCDGTGIYCGVAERFGEGVPCHTCGSTGKRLVEIKPFRRKIHRSVDTILYRRKSGNVRITYEEFLAGEIPPDEES